jgi:isochorismate pyruvate lyase
MKEDIAPPQGGVPPEDCQDMTQVRAGVDALDKALVALLAERQKYMVAAARIKASRRRVHDDSRIEEVLANVADESRRVGLSQEIAIPVWRTLVAQSIAFELTQWDRIHGGAE